MALRRGVCVVDRTKITVKYIAAPLSERPTGQSCGSTTPQVNGIMLDEIYNGGRADGMLVRYSLQSICPRSVSLSCQPQLGRLLSC